MPGFESIESRAAIFELQFFEESRNGQSRRAKSRRANRALAILGVVWFAVSCAVYARFIDLPEIPFLTDRIALYLSGGWNALWWGFAKPYLERQRDLITAREAATPGVHPEGE